MQRGGLIPPTRARAVAPARVGARADPRATSAWKRRSEAEISPLRNEDEIRDFAVTIPLIETRSATSLGVTVPIYSQQDGIFFGKRDNPPSIGVKYCVISAIWRKV